jgi:hypothetical protein
LRIQGAVDGEYSTDLLVEGVLLVELKTVKELGDVQRMQGTNTGRSKH